MKTRISVQERLKDLRVEQGLNLEELAQKTGIHKPLTFHLIFYKFT